PDDELLLAIELELYPGGVPFARRVPRVATLGDHPLETETRDGVDDFPRRAGQLDRQQDAGVSDHVRQSVAAGRERQVPQGGAGLGREIEGRKEERVVAG